MSGGKVLGAVLAGGRSRRYGADKSAARVGGVPMVERVLSVAAAVADEVVLVSSRPVAGAETAPRIADRIPDLGPLGGLHAALHEARDRGMGAVLLLPCDVPLVSPAFLRSILGARGDAPAAAPARDGGIAEVLCAVYGVEVLPAVERRVRGEDRSLQGLFREVGGRPLALADLDLDHDGALLNVNTPEERRRADREARVGSAGETGA